MKKFKVNHIVTCRVNVWRTIEAHSFDDALRKVATIECITDTSNGADLEVVSDDAVNKITISEVLP